MGQETKQDRLNRLRGVGLEGSMSRSEAMGSGDPRHRRGPQRELGFTQRFNTRQFEVDADGRVSLKLATPKPETIVVTLTLKTDDPSTSSDAPLRKVGFVTGHSLEDTADFIHTHFHFPPDLDRSQPMELELYYVERLSTSAIAYTITLTVFRAEDGLNVNKSADATFSITGTTAGVLGTEFKTSHTLEPGIFLTPKATAVHTHMIHVGALQPNILVYRATLTYTPLDYHAHE